MSNIAYMSASRSTSGRALLCPWNIKHVKMLSHFTIPLVRVQSNILYRDNHAAGKLDPSVTFYSWPEFVSVLARYNATN